MSRRKTFWRTVWTLAMLSFAAGCVSNSQRPNPVSLQVQPQVERIELGAPGLRGRVNDAFDSALSEPRTRVGDTLRENAEYTATTGEDGIVGWTVALMAGLLGKGIGVAERGATFVGNVADAERKRQPATRAEIQLAAAAQQINAATVFAEFLPVSEAGDVLAIMRRISVVPAREGGADLTIDVELVNGAGGVLQRYSHEARFRAEHPDLAARPGRTSSAARTIRTGIAEIANQIATDFNIVEFKTQ
jgi:hypothetical protein